MHNNTSEVASSRTVLVTGGAGYIGSRLVRDLLDRRYRVRVLDRLMFGARPLDEIQDHGSFRLIEGDFRDANTVAEAVGGADAVVHLGAIVGDPACAANEHATLQTNYSATGLIAEACRQAGVPRMLFASTCSVYGASDEIVDETSAPGPISLYASTKLESEALLLKARSAVFHPTVLRLGTAFGWSPRPRFDLVVNLLTAKAFFENEVVIFNEDQWRPFIHVDDISRAFTAALEAPLEQVSGEIFNTGSSSMNLRLRDVAESIRLARPGVRVRRQNNSDRRNYRASFDKIEKALGFRCHVSLESGVEGLNNALALSLVEDYTDPVYHNHKHRVEPGAFADHRPSTLQLKAGKFAFPTRFEGVGVKAEA